MLINTLLIQLACFLSLSLSLSLSLFLSLSLSLWAGAPIKVEEYIDLNTQRGRYSGANWRERNPGASNLILDATENRRDLFAFVLPESLGYLNHFAAQSTSGTGVDHRAHSVYRRMFPFYLTRKIVIYLLA